MWIIYKLWGFLLLKPALGVLQIPAQSIATQSSLLSAESLTAPFPTTTTFLFSDMSLFNLIKMQLYWPTVSIKTIPNIIGYKGKGSKRSVRDHRALTSHFLNDSHKERECDKRSRENRDDVGKCGGGEGVSFRVSPLGVRQWETGQRCLFRPINRETSLVL